MDRQTTSLAAFLALGLSACIQANEPDLVGRATVIDGDTLEIRSQRIRVWGIDAPESSQTCERSRGRYRCGAEAANRLDGWLVSRQVACWEVERDRYDRMVARCSVEGEDLGVWLVRQGYAVRYARYAGSAYRTEEREAREAHRGVWGGTFQYPWEWRRQQRP